MSRPSPSLEILESRIAPSIFLVGGTDLTIKDVTAKTAATNETADATETGAGFALAVFPRDSVVYDVNHNGLVDRADVKLLTVSGAEARAFFTDTNGNGKFDLTEFTGLALTPETKATVTGDIHGSVAVALDSFGALLSTGGTLTFEDGSLAGLTVTGHIIGGDVLAGGDITNVTIKNPVGTRGSVASVDGDLAAGSAAGGRAISFSGGVKILSTATDEPVYGSISKIKLANGAHGILAGDGFSGTTAGGGGGSITDITIGDTTVGDLIIKAGKGGANTGSGAAGSGGDISKLNIRTSTTHKIQILAGGGGNSANWDQTLPAGGFGGDVKNVTIVAPRDFDSFELRAGTAGSVGTSTQGARGALGGSVIGLTATLGYTANGVIVYAGNGGDGQGAGTNGGSGGALSNVKLAIAGSGGMIDIEAGFGGSAHSPLATGGAEASGGISGYGGDISKLTLLMTGDSTGDIQVVAGSGGNVLHGTGIAHSGGGISKTTVTTQAAGKVTILGGQGGQTLEGGTGGFGGAVDGVTLINRSTVGAVGIGSGSGGDAVGAAAATPTVGGSGADLTNITVTNTGRMQSLHVIAGAGGKGTGVGNGGSGGDLKKVKITNLGQAADSQSGEVFLFAGAGGKAAQGDGGFGGDVDRITYNDPIGMTSQLNGATFTGVVFISAGNGGDTTGEDQKGGFGGDVTNVTLKAPHTVFSVGLPDAKGGNGYTSGGSGGNIRGITGTVEAISIAAMDGGKGTGIGNGGSGGDVTNINLTVTEFAQSIRAGNGGDTGSVAGSGGFGGSIRHVKAVGDIGDFSSPFFVQFPGVGMGGLIAGQGGINGGLTTARALNGEIEDVSAGRIAAILAGRPSVIALSAENAVSSIKKVKASIIGADLNGDGAFTFLEGDNQQIPSAYELPAGANGDGDIALDGLVIVRAGQFTGTRPPILKLIEV